MPARKHDLCAIGILQTVETNSFETSGWRQAVW